MQQPGIASLDESIATYCKAWCEPDRALRKQLLDRVWSEEGTYTDPTAHVAGRKDLVEHIGKFFEQFPGARIVQSSAVDTHHDKFRFTWRLVLPDGAVPVEGIDFGELSSNGQLRHIVGFFGPLALKP